MNAKRTGLWILVIALAAEFTIAGISKFGDHSVWARMFSAWGFPYWLRPLVGSIEVGCGVGLLVPRARRWACLPLLCVMSGAILTQLIYGGAGRSILPLVLFLLLAFIGKKAWEHPDIGLAPPPE